MSDDEKLAAPAFEQLPSGIRFTEPGFSCGAAVVELDIQYERRTISFAISTSPAQAGAVGRETVERVAVKEVAPYVLPAALVDQVAGFGAAGKAPMSRTGPAKYREPAGAARGVAGFALHPTTFVVADMAPVAAGGPPRLLRSLAETAVIGQSYTEAAAVMRQRLASHPAGWRRLRVMPAYLAGASAQGRVREGVPK